MKKGTSLTIPDIIPETGLLSIWEDQIPCNRWKQSLSLQWKGSSEGAG
ncbi:hypothetical protein ACP6L2_14900 [Sphingobacterium lactis]